MTMLLLIRSRFNYVIQDPTVNLLISSVIINYILPGVAMILCSVRSLVHTCHVTTIVTCDWCRCCSARCAGPRTAS